MTTDGMAALVGKRETATASQRRIPPPRNRPRAQQEVEARHEPPVAQGSTKRAKGRKPGQVVASSVTGERQATSDAGDEASASPEVKADLIRATVYLGDEDDIWLSQISAGGQVRRPRVDAPRSAVMRLALERLRGQMSQEEIVDLLAARAANMPSHSIGRKRL